MKTIDIKFRIYERWLLSKLNEEDKAAYIYLKNKHGASKPDGYYDLALQLIENDSHFKNPEAFEQALNIYWEDMESGEIN